MSSQQTCASYLKRCTTPREVEGILSAYICAKYARRDSPSVLHKFRLLIMYLRTTGLGHLVTQYSPIFTHLAFHIQYLNGGAIGATRTESPLENECWNELRRKKEYIGRLDSPWGLLGPGSVARFRGGLDSLRSAGPLRSREETEEWIDLFGRERLTAEELSLLGLQTPTYQSQTLPPYDAGEEEVQT